MILLLFYVAKLGGYFQVPDRHFTDYFTQITDIQFRRQYKVKSTTSAPKNVLILFLLFRILYIFA